jgi:hypothetical protein
MSSYKAAQSEKAMKISHVCENFLCHEEYISRQHGDVP